MLPYEDSGSELNMHSRDVLDCFEVCKKSCELWKSLKCDWCVKCWGHQQHAARVSAILDCIFTKCQNLLQILYSQWNSCKDSKWLLPLGQLSFPRNSDALKLSFVFNDCRVEKWPTDCRIYILTTSLSLQKHTEVIHLLSPYSPPLAS